jgi:hypothetical protein
MLKSFEIWQSNWFILVARPILIYFRLFATHKYSKTFSHKKINMTYCPFAHLKNIKKGFDL